MTLARTIFVCAVTLSAGAQAQTFDQEHPRRGEVIRRLDNEDARINAGRRSA